MEHPHDEKAGDSNSHNTAGSGPHQSGRALHWVLMFLASFAVMYFAMYAMADRLEHVYLNLSNVWMTGFMTAAMFVPMLLLMGGMLPGKKTKSAVWLSVLVIGAMCWIALRTEAGVSDTQFLRAMIPHHSAAIQMCHQSSITDPRVKKLCQEIIESQEREIAQMRALLSEGR
jgi:hypothetical protein